MKRTIGFVKDKFAILCRPYENKNALNDPCQGRSISETCAKPKRKNTKQKHYIKRILKFETVLKHT